MTRGGQDAKRLSRRDGEARENLRRRNAFVRHQQPEAEDGLGQNIEDGISDNLAVNRDVSGTVTDGPDAVLAG